MTYTKTIAVILLLMLFGPSQISAQSSQNLDNILPEGLNKLYAVADQWALYGAPQPGPMSSDDWETLLSTIRKTSFGVNLVQVVVIIEGSDVEGTLGLVDRRKGRRLTTMRVGQKGLLPYDIWRGVGYKTSAQKIYNDLQQNVLAINRYHDMPVIINSRVRRVSFDPAGSPYVELNVGHRPQDGILACYPWVGAPQLLDITALTAGDNIAATCQISSFSKGVLKMTSCLFNHHTLLGDLL